MAVAATYCGGQAVVVACLCIHHTLASWKYFKGYVSHMHRHAWPSRAQGYGADIPEFTVGVVAGILQALVRWEAPLTTIAGSTYRGIQNTNFYIILYLSSGEG